MIAELRRAAGAEPFFRIFTYGGASDDPIAGWLENFNVACDLTTADLRRAWGTFGPFDLVYFNSARPAQVAALGLWMKQTFRTPAQAPGVAIELGTEAGLTRSGPDERPSFTVREPTAVLYRQAANLVGAEWMARMTFLTVTPAAAAEYEFILKTPAKVVPMPQALPPLRRRTVNGALTIGFVGHQRPDKGWQFVSEAVQAVLCDHASVRFVAHQSDPESMADVTQGLRGLAAREPRLELLVQPAVNSAWFALLDRCDIVALPYDPMRYQAAYSAIVGEALSAGAPIVVPADTTMSSALAAAGGPGTTFAAWNAASIAAGIGQAIERFGDLAGRAYEAGQDWHGRHGPDRFVSAVIEAAGRGFGGAARRGPARRAMQSIGRLIWR
ncbi:MAG: glycosyltransferase [Alphaproteobacteria bacterium]|nr:glycosyltransferase [Alphaproteobacteria bacterium]